MEKGYIKLWRRVLNSNLWKQEKFTRGQAWIDLIMLANHKDGYIRKRGIRVDLKRGDIGWSERELSKRWRWSRDKVRRFLNELCSDNEQKLRPQTRPQNKNVTACYSIVNYSLYQDGQTINNTTNRPQTGHKQDQNKNDKNEKNEKNIKKRIFIKPFLGEFKNVKITQIEFNKLEKQFIDALEKIEALSVYIKSKGDTYKDHYATILNWERMAVKKGKTGKAGILQPTTYAQGQDAERRRRAQWLKDQQNGQQPDQETGHLVRINDAG